MLDFFPSGTLAWSMAKMFVVRSLAVLIVLILVLQVLDLLGESDKILGVPGNGQAQLLTYVSLRIPELVQRFLPFCVLLGTLVTLVTLNQNSEVIAMKAAGLSAHQVLAPLVLASLVLAGLSFAFNDRVVSRASATLDRWQALEYRPLPPLADTRSNVWVRDGDDLIHAGTVLGTGNGTKLRDLSIFDRRDGALLAITTAASASVRDSGWLLDNVSRFDVATGRTTRSPMLEFGNGIAPDRFTLLKVDGDGLSFGALRRAIGELEAAGRPTDALKAQLWHKISGPLSTILMPLLGAVAAFGLARAGQLFVRAVIGMALGFAYFVADNFGIAMGNLGAYPPLLAAWGPFFLFLLIGEAVLIRTEE